MKGRRRARTVDPGRIASRLDDAADGLLAWWKSERAGNGDRAGLHPTTVSQRMRDLANEISAKENGK